MNKTISDVFPQLARISDADMRDKVSLCWKEAIKRGGWTVEQLETIPFTLTLDEQVNISIAAHTNHVTNCAIALGEVMKPAYKGMFDLDMDILVAGGLLHDVGKLLEFARDGDGYKVSEDGRLRRHPISGCALAAEVGLPESVQHMIATHSWEGDKAHRTPESYIVHHSDFVNYHPLKDA